jgi:hypothetical protein
MMQQQQNQFLGSAKKMSLADMKKTIGGSKYPDYWVCSQEGGFFCYEGALECETFCQGGCFQYAGCL